ncbi:hypothetical protein HORIV_68450 [Vreelandella olivaria]|uniref:Uncharacterized protein n=1 Tax=Vreelandella olivaria TaxID=390919 RepID=A0ABM7GUK0_9GAMM|nr:hypothetical protein HORIV_68450 [Halomonas olivaria]
MGGLRDQSGQALQVFGMLGIDRRLGQALVNRVIRRQYRAIGIVWGDFTFEAIFF